MHRGLRLPAVPKSGGVKFPIDTSPRRRRRYAISGADRENNEPVPKEGSLSCGSGWQKIGWKQSLFDRTVQAVSTIEVAHTYPRELSEQIWALWMRADGTDTLLDSPEKLNAFVSIAYQASLLREEGRAVECRIALIGLQHLEHAILEAGFHPIRFAKRRMFCGTGSWPVGARDWILSIDDRR